MNDTGTPECNAWTTAFLGLDKIRRLNEREGCVICGEMFTVSQARPRLQCRKCTPAWRRIQAKTRALTLKLIKAGVLERQPCEMPGCVADSEIHHVDYRDASKVRWLCRTHHWWAHLCIDMHTRPTKVQP